MCELGSQLRSLSPLVIPTVGAGVGRLPMTCDGEWIGSGILLGVFTRYALAAELEWWVRRRGNTPRTVVLERILLDSSPACRVEVLIHCIIRDFGQRVIVRIRQEDTGQSKSN